MKLAKSFLVLAVVVFAPAVASAQRYGGGGGGGYYQNPSNTQHPGGFHNRSGRLMYGASLGLGVMNENGERVDCGTCDYSPISGMGSLHVGGFVGPRLALMGEVQGNVQTISDDRYDSESLIQGTLMFAAQYWVTPQLWVKGGIGVANLRVESYYYGTDELPENGLALLGAVGFEVLSAQRFSIDLQGRLINGSYDGAGVNVSAATVGVGLNWY